MSQGYLNRTGINFFENFVTKITVYRSLTPPRKFVSQVSTGRLAVVYQAEVKDLRGDTCKWRGDEKIYTTLRLRFDPLAANCIQMTIVNPARPLAWLRNYTEGHIDYRATWDHVLSRIAYEICWKQIITILISRHYARCHSWKGIVVLFSRFIWMKINF